MRNTERRRKYQRDYYKMPVQRKKALARTKKWRNTQKGKEATRKHHILARGITPEIFNQMKCEQDNKCAICHQIFTTTPCIDHNHQTGKVRGLLCRNCNLILGISGDNPTTLKRAADYLTDE